MRLAPYFLSLCLGLSACATVPQAPGLEGSTWRLVRFEPRDAGASIQSGDTARYTLNFGSDGRVAAKLDCNRGTGPWQVTKANAQGGSLRIGPLATTRAMCPPDPIGARLPQDLDAVSSYRLQDGRLYMHLPADAGTYVWEALAP